MPTKLEVEDWPIDRIVPYARNPRFNEGAVAKVAASISEFGWRQSLVVDEDCVVIVGHTRLLAAKQLGHSTVPVNQVFGWSDSKKRAYRLMDNRSHDESKWDEELLRLELLDFPDDFDMSLTGFDELELARLTKEMNDLNTDPDEIPKDIEKRASLGDLWLLGTHRLLCGDSTSEAAVDRLLDGAKPEIMVTDPPYGVSYDPGWRHEVGLNNSDRRGKVMNDDTPSWLPAWELFTGPVAYVWHSGKHGNYVFDDLVTAGFELRSQIIWIKSRFPISRSHYHWQHEACFYVVRKGSRAKWTGDRKQTTIWRADELAADREDKTTHGTQKPEFVMGRALDNHGVKTVYDPFIGSGTTLISAERRDIACYALELDPSYVDMTLQRWQNATGLEPELLSSDARLGGEQAPIVPPEVPEDRPA